MSYFIFIKGLRIHAGHRSPDHQVAPNNGQFVVDLVLSSVLADASYSDRLGDTTNYSDVVATVTTAFSRSDHFSLETTAGKLAEAVLSAHHLIDQVTVMLHARMPAMFEDTRIRVIRSRYSRTSAIVG
jgi:dihydroneopterin aldolase